MDLTFVDSGWIDVLDAASKTDSLDMRLVCPFIKKKVVERLLKNVCPKSIRVITRFCLSDFCAGVSDISALRLLLEAGAQIRGVQNLHAKVYLFGMKRAVVTSANLTYQALTRNHEFGFTSDDPSVLAHCDKYFNQFWKDAGADLRVEQLGQWESDLDTVDSEGARPSKVSGLRDFGTIAVSGGPEIAFPPLVSDAPQGFVKLFGEGDSRMDRQTDIIEEIERSGCHWACTYPKNRRPRSVVDGAIMFMGRMADKPNDILIYGRAIGKQHRPGYDDATEDDIKVRKWKARWPHYVRVHHAEFIAGPLANGVSLDELMRVLGSDSFAATQRNAVMKYGNTNPRTAYRQQPAVELSREGMAWLNAKFEDALREHGKLSPEELDRLDWPEITVNL